MKNIIKEMSGNIIDLADCHDCETAQVRIYQDRLRFRVAYHPNSAVPVELIEVALKFRPEI